MRRCGIEIEITFFDILAVVSLGVGEPEEAFLEDRIPSVPERDSKAKNLFVIGESSQPVFAPVIGTRAGLIVAEPETVHAGGVAPRCSAPRMSQNSQPGTWGDGQTGLSAALVETPSFTPRHYRCLFAAAGSFK